ncbi:MAG: hypothetical protein J1E98_00635 [Lachnospiraceae bacterium]|nr:hypothetical protein [Lachnospiraceae bacterium]
MRVQQTYYQSGVDLWNTKKHVKHNSMADVQQHPVNNTVDNVSISKEGMNALREKVGECASVSADIDVHKMTIHNTNEVTWEHYAAIREFQEPLFQNGDYDVNDLMESLAEAYETLYNKIIEEHTNGDRQVNYQIAGECSVTLEDDLEGLDDAYKWSMSNLAGYITCQQTNKAFANPNSAWYFNRLGLQFPKENSPQVKKMYEDYNYLDQKYINTVISIMKQSRENFLTLFNNADYKKGMMKGIVSNMINGNTDFVTKTQKLFS